jgi:hypothetical protein
MDDYLNNRQSNGISRDSYWPHDDAGSKQQCALVEAQWIDSRAISQRIMESSRCELTHESLQHLNMVVTLQVMIK